MTSATPNVSGFSPEANVLSHIDFHRQGGRICAIIKVALMARNTVRVATRFGIRLAQKLSEHLPGLHVVGSRLLEGPLLTDISG